MSLSSLLLLSHLFFLLMVAASTEIICEMSLTNAPRVHIDNTMSNHDCFFGVQAALQCVLYLTLVRLCAPFCPYPMVDGDLVLVVFVVFQMNFNIQEFFGEFDGHAHEKRLKNAAVIRWPYRFVYIN